mmetsp:Transcript_37248/g.88105  ORF Transcript_37248/g.88105 Transcript_37248/m.88105 type:complete len:183 (-) Transcript_37248:6-554(-)
MQWPGKTHDYNRNGVEEEAPPDLVELKLRSDTILPLLLLRPLPPRKVKTQEKRRWAPFAFTPSSGTELRFRSDRRIVGKPGGGEDSRRPSISSSNDHTGYGGAAASSTGIKRISSNSPERTEPRSGRLPDKRGGNLRGQFLAQEEAAVPAPWHGAAASSNNLVGGRQMRRITGDEFLKSGVF